MHLYTFTITLYSLFVIIGHYFIFEDFTSKATREKLKSLGMTQVHDEKHYADYYTYLDTYYSKKVQILPLKR